MGIRILNGGFLTTVQDMGRYGSQETGMAVCGPGGSSGGKR